MDFVPFQQLIVSMALGLLLGLERERTEPSIAGIRTFPLISLFGTVCAQVGEVLGGWIVAAGLVGLAATLIFANMTRIKSGDIDAGITTEVAALLMYGLGALLVVGSMAAAVVVGGAMALLLHFKQPLHRFAAAVGDRDMHAIMQFVVVSLVILPVLPHEDYGPYGVWNPFKLWLMVVFIVGISLAGYVAYKLFGARAGSLLGAVIGGIISSTATTVSFARRAAGSVALAPLAAMVIMIASCLSFVRVLGEIAAVAPGSFATMGPPLMAMLGVCVLISGGLYLASGKSKTKMPEQKNPAELKSALIFAALYAVVLLAVAAAEDRFGQAGLFVVAVISGLTDMDAITLSTAQMTVSGGLDPFLAWKVILMAAMANFVFKFGIVAALGSVALTWRVGLAFAVALVSGGSIIWLWPVADSP